MSIDDHLEFRLLKYIVAIAEAGTFSGAAALLHVSQPTLSTQIRTLEDILEVRLFDREHGNTLTTEGRVMLRYCISTLETRRHFIQTLQAIHCAKVMPLRLGFSPFVQQALLRLISDTYKELLPGCDILPESGDTDEITNRMHESQLDAAILTLPIVGEGLHVTMLESERLVVCMRSNDPLADYNEVPATELNGKISIFAYQRHHPVAYNRLLEMFHEVGITPRPCNPTMNLDHVQWMVREGHCYSLIRIGRSLASGLVTRPIAGVNWTIDTAFISKANDENPALNLFVEELENRFWRRLETPEKKASVSARMREVTRRTADKSGHNQLALFPVQKEQDE